MRSFLGTLLFAVLLVLGMGLARPARALAEPKLIGILSIETRGVSELAAEQFESEVEEALDGVGVQSVNRAAMRKKLEGSEFMEGCFFGPCLATLRGASGVPTVLVANIHGHGSSYSFVVTLIETRTGTPTSQVSQTCAVCTIEEAISTATLTTISLLTGTGDTKSVKSISQRSEGEEAAPRAHSSARGSVQRSGLILLGVGAVGLISGAYLLREDKRDFGLVALSSGAGLVTGGATMLLLSRRF